MSFMEKYRAIIIFGIPIIDINYNKFLGQFRDVIANQKQIAITYVTTNSLNKIYNSKQLVELFTNFDIIHPDGVGVYLASKILSQGNDLSTRITGSDFYPMLAKKAAENNWKMFLLTEKWSKLGNN